MKRSSKEVAAAQAGELQHCDKQGDEECLVALKAPSPRVLGCRWTQACAPSPLPGFYLDTPFSATMPQDAPSRETAELLGWVP